MRRRSGGVGAASAAVRHAVAIEAGERRQPRELGGTAAAIPGSSQRSEGSSLRSDFAQGSVGTRPFEGFFSTSRAGGWRFLARAGAADPA